MERAGRIHLRRGLGQPKLEGDRVGGAPWARGPQQTRRELVDRALSDADQRGREIPSGHAAQGHAVAQSRVDLPARLLVGPGALGIDRAAGGDEGVLDDDVLAAAAPHPGGEPRVDDLVVRPGEQQPHQGARSGAGDGDHRPGGGVAAAREPPAARDPEPAGDRLHSPAGGIEPAGEERVRTRGEELVLALLGEVAEPPVVRGPQRVAPGGRSAAAAELEARVVSGVHLETVAAVALGVADPDQCGVQEIAHALGWDLSELLGLCGPLLQDGNELLGAAKELVSGESIHDL